LFKDKKYEQQPFLFTIEYLGVLGVPQHKAKLVLSRYATGLSSTFSDPYNDFHLDI
jgi:hypothetical protein